MSTRFTAVARLADALASALGGAWRAEPFNDPDPREFFLTDASTGGWAVVALDLQSQTIALAAARPGQPPRQAESYMPTLGPHPDVHAYLSTADLDEPAATMARALRSAVEPPDEADPTD